MIDQLILVVALVICGFLLVVLAMAVQLMRSGSNLRRDASRISSDGARVRYGSVEALRYSNSTAAVNNGLLVTEDGTPVPAGRISNHTVDRLLRGE